MIQAGATSLHAASHAVYLDKTLHSQGDDTMSDMLELDNRAFWDMPFYGRPA